MTFYKEIRLHMQHALIRLITLFAIVAMVCGCDSNNERVRRTIRETVNSVTPEAILRAASELDKRYVDSDETLIPLDTLPASFAAFEPVEVYYSMSGSYTIVTDKWVSHRSGLRITAPREVIPASTRYETYEKLSGRIYLYQN